MSDSVMFDVFRVPVPTVHNGDVFVSNNASVVVVSARNFLVKPEFGTLVDTQLTVNAAATFLNTLDVTSLRYSGANSLVLDVLTQATYHDYTHAGLAQAGVLQLLPTQNVTLLGIDSPALDGTSTRVLIVQNLAAGYSITLAHANTQSTEGNRFTLPSGTAVTIPGSGSVQLVWSTETKDWRVLGGAGGSSTPGDANNALFLNGQPASYYTNATNITTGTLPVARLTGTYNINVSGTAYGKAEAALNVNSAVSATSATSALTANNATYAFGKTEGNLNVNNAVTAGTANNATYAFGKTEGNLQVLRARLTSVVDTRDTDYAPNDHGVGVQWDFRTKTVSSIPGTGTFAAVQTVSHWSDTTGGYRHQLAITDDNDLYIRQATSNTVWSTTWRKFYHTGNMPTEAVNLASVNASSYLQTAVIQIRADDNGSSPGRPWMRGNGSHLVINAHGEALYLNWDTSLPVYTGAGFVTRGSLTANGAITANGSVLAPNGNTSAPAFAASADTDTGIFFEQGSYPAVVFTVGSKEMGRFYPDGGPKFVIPNGAHGNYGTMVSIGASTSVNGGPGLLRMWSSQTNQFDRYFWVDNSGNFRIHYAPATAVDQSSIGTIVGTQTSQRAVKNVDRKLQPSDDAAALKLIAQAPVYKFTYKPGMGLPGPFVGIITDDTPELGMDNGKSLNPVNAVGYLISCIKALLRRIESLEESRFML